MKIALTLTAFSLLMISSASAVADTEVVDTSSVVGYVDAIGIANGSPWTETVFLQAHARMMEKGAYLCQTQYPGSTAVLLSSFQRIQGSRVTEAGHFECKI
jgi:hypothetical protein